MKKKIFHNALPFEIILHPDPLDKELLGENEKVDDCCWIQDDERRGLLYVGIFFGCVPLLFFLIKSISSQNVLTLFLIHSLLSLPGLLIILYYFTCPPQKLILNRVEGTVECPPFLYGKPKKFLFSEIIPVATFAKMDYYLSLKPPIQKWTDYFISIPVQRSSGRRYLEEWSLIVWYMDKNRPLPPGTAFDPYRKRDEERRKKEGYPPPLYPSRIHNEQGILYPIEKEFTQKN
ncbi:MAG: hypothetical protein N2053_04345 [Chitinispirillaceae bacterium]|nr:hypothetical protein [Chitinispirillaceae bacterium]